MAVARQRINKKISAIFDTHATMEEILDKVLSMLSMSRLYNEDDQEVGSRQLAKKS
jgi:hypothetical protein